MIRSREIADQLRLAERSLARLRLLLEINAPKTVIDNEVLILIHRAVGVRFLLYEVPGELRETTEGRDAPPPP